MGGGTPVHPGLDMHTLAPPLEPEAGSNILNLHIYSDFFSIFISWHLTMSQFVHFIIISQIISCTLILFTIFFSRVFIQHPSQSLSGDQEAVQPGQDAHALRHPGQDAHALRHPGPGFQSGNIRNICCTQTKSS